MEKSAFEQMGAALIIKGAVIFGLICSRLKVFLLVSGGNGGSTT